jgi:twitching motility protein PilT
VGDRFILVPLLPRIDGGRIPAAEMLMVGYGARRHIRKNALQHLNQEITITRKAGSFTLEGCLVNLIGKGLIERGEGALRARHPDEFEKALAAAGI